MNELPSYHIFPLGDNAVVVDFGNRIDETLNKLVHSIFYQLQHDPLPGMIEAVPGYSSITVYYDVLMIRDQSGGPSTAFEQVCEGVKKYITAENIEAGDPQVLIRIPVCYDKRFGPDLDFIASKNDITTEEIIQLHSSATYRVFMLGFLPGFTYMGLVNERISSPRKQQPTPVEPGSVGIAGRQTGIYPFKSPGGWQIIGRTPLKLFDKERVNPVVFKSGDHVQFYSIPMDEFDYLKNNPPLP